MLTVGSIENIQATKEIAEDVWKDMAKFASTRTKDEFLNDTRELEILYAEKWFSDVEEARTSSGKWKKSFTDKNGERVKIIPGAWSTAKSVLVTAMDAGVEFVDRGQTAVAKEAREKLKDGEKTPYQKVVYSINKIDRLISQGGFSDSEFRTIKNELDILANRIVLPLEI